MTTRIAVIPSFVASSGATIVSNNRIKESAGLLQSVNDTDIWQLRVICRRPPEAMGRLVILEEAIKTVEFQELSALLHRSLC